MSIHAELRGNLTADPQSKTVRVDGELRTIVEMRVFSDEYRREGDALVQDDDKCTGVDVTIWSERLGERALALLRKGARVRVYGTLYLNRYPDRETGESRAGLRMTAETCDLAFNRVESVAFKPARGKPESDSQRSSRTTDAAQMTATGTPALQGAGGFNDMDDDIPY